MQAYFKTDEKLIFDFSPEYISSMYNKGYLFTRLGKGVMHQTRSLRINLEKFELNSENKRILKKVEAINIDFKNLPLEDYSWEIHKLGKDFYTKKFGDGTMSASKIKEMFNNQETSNMNSVFTYSLQVSKLEKVGYCLCYSNSEILHYAYPFYNLVIDLPNLGIGMMTKAIIWSKENGKKYLYLGSITNEKSKYKLQFSGLEWWHENEWVADINELKNILQI